MLQRKLLRPWSGRNSKYQVKHFDRRLFRQEGGTHSFRVQCSMRGAVCQCICSSLEDSWGGLDGITIDYTFHHIQVAMHAMLSCIIASLLKRKPQHPFCAMPQPSQMRAGISCFCSTTLLGSFVSVHSSACSTQLLQSHRIQFWDRFLNQGAR